LKALFLKKRWPDNTELCAIVEETFGRSIESEEETARTKFSDYRYQYKKKIKELAEEFTKG
jgi:hypothetical protein